MRVEEPAAESFLHRLWEQRIAGKILRTVDGRTVEILSPGTRNFDAGPDYRHATIRLDGRLVHGDIEIHPCAEDWNRHGHHRDPAYNRVVLHLVTSGCPPDARTVRADGASVPIVDLDQHLPRPAEEMEAAEEARTPASSPQTACSLAAASLEDKLRVIQEASLQRLETKADRFREERAVADWDQIAFRGLFDALGYAKNQAPARALADRLPVADLWRFTGRFEAETALSHLQAWLFGASGLLDAMSDDPEPPVKQFADVLRSLWQAYPNRRKVDPLAPADWKFFRLRPANFPTRRIAAMAQLVLRHRQEGFVQAWARTLRAAHQARTAAHRELERTLVVDAFGFWAERDCFLTGKVYRAARAPQLLGPERARDIVVNVVLPITVAYADEIGDGLLRTTTEETYRSYPRHADNEILRAMYAQLFGIQEGGRRFIRTAALQQGLIQLHKFGCRIGDCGFCEGLAGIRS